MHVKTQIDHKHTVTGSTFQNHGEETANSITHGIGALLGITALVLLVVCAARHGDAWRVVSCSIYGSTLIFLYTASTLYHSFREGRVKRLFRILDHASIYLLIAGTYTPILLISLRGPWGWTLFGIVWAMAIAGVAAKSALTGKYDFLSTLCYIAMGWMIIVAIKPLLSSAPAGFVVWLGIGGLAYTAGTVFYLWERIPYNHAIWHLFVLAGSISHFFGILFYLSQETT